MEVYTKRIALWMGLIVGGLSATPAAAASVVTVGVGPGPVIAVARPPMPMLGWVWMEPAIVISPFGLHTIQPGYWAPPAPVIAHRVVAAPMVRTTVVRPAPTVRRVVTRPAPRTVVVRRR